MDPTQDGEAHHVGLSSSFNRLRNLPDAVRAMLAVVSPEGAATVSLSRDTMPRDTHTTLLDRDELPFLVKGLRSDSIREPVVPVTFDGVDVGAFQGIEVFEKTPGSGSTPQIIADLVSNAYVRLTYQKENGHSGTFGTSFVAAFSFRPKGKPLLLIPTVSRAEIVLDNRHCLHLSLIGAYGTYGEIVSTRTFAARAENRHTCVRARATFVATADIELEPTTLGNDSFRLFTCSSMYANSTRYDGNILRWAGETVAELDLRTVETRGGYLFRRPVRATQLAIAKSGGSTGQRGTPGAADSPSVESSVIDSSLPITELAAQGFLANTTDVNDDSLTAWLEWVNAPLTVPTGMEITWTAELAARPPQTT